MKMDLDTLCKKVEATASTACAFPIAEVNQIIVTFSNRPDVEVALLTPYAQQQIKHGYIDDNVLNDTLICIQSIAINN